MKKYNPVSSIPRGVLAVILQYIDREFHDNKGCYEAFIEKIKDADPDEISLKLNETDDENKTPLHYAIRYVFMFKLLFIFKCWPFNGREKCQSIIDDLS